MTPEGLRLNSASPDLLRTLLDEFEDELRRAGVGFEGWLKPGLDPDEVRATLTVNGFSPNEEVVTWFAWHNGESAPFGASAALPRFALRDLDQVIRHFNGEYAQPRGLDWWQWNPAWLRIAWDYGEGIAVRLNPDPTNTPLVRYVTDDGEFGTQASQTERQVVSLCTPVAWWIKSLRRGWYRFKAHQGVQWSQEGQPSERAVIGLS